MKGVRTVLVLSLVFVATVGWAGIFFRGWYAAPHFIEPWADIADEAATSVEHGDIVVGNSPSFLFYANYALRKHGMLQAPFSPGWVEDPRIVAVDRWSSFDSPNYSTVLFVDGVNTSTLEETDRVQSWLRSNCVLLSMRQLVPDPGYLLKTRFFKGYPRRPYRIELERYKCPSPARPSPQLTH